MQPGEDWLWCYTDQTLVQFVIKVESLDATITELADRGVDADAAGSPDGSDDVRTTWITAADWPD